MENEERMMRKTVCRNLAGKAVILAALAVFGLSAAAPAQAEYRHEHFRHEHFRHDRGHFGVGVGVGVGPYYGEPPVVYAPPAPVYAAPPVVYSPPGITLGFHFR
jgi:hypothetical protein